MSSTDELPTPREPARFCVESAKAHYEASKVLAAAGRSDFATFHLLTSLEEICKSRLVGPAFLQLTVALGEDGLSVPAKAMTRSLFSHSTKIPLGVFLALVQSGPLAMVKHPRFPTGLTSSDVAELKARELAQAEWVAKNLQDPEDIRERAIYAGLDHAGLFPPRLDWTEFVHHLSQLIEDQLDFSEYLAQQEMTPKISLGQGLEQRGGFQSCGRKATRGLRRAPVRVRAARGLAPKRVCFTPCDVPHRTRTNHRTFLGLAAARGP